MNSHNNKDLTNQDTTILQDVITELGLMPDNSNKYGRPLLKKELSLISKMYDVDGDGILDDEEKAARDLDTNGVGFLNNAKVVKMIREKVQVESSNKKLKKTILFLATIAALLAVSNLGTGFVAAILAKDTQTEHGDLTDKTTGKTLGTLAKLDHMEWINQAETEDDEPFYCLSDAKMANLWTKTQEQVGVTTTLIDENRNDDPEDTLPTSQHSVEFTAQGSSWNETHLCYGTAGGRGSYCVDFTDTRCADKLGDARDRKLLTGQTHHEHNRRVKEIVAGRRDACFSGCPTCISIFPWLKSGAGADCGQMGPYGRMMEEVCPCATGTCVPFE